MIDWLGKQIVINDILCHFVKDIGCNIEFQRFALSILFWGTTFGVTPSWLFARLLWHPLHSLPFNLANCLLVLLLVYYNRFIFLDYLTTLLLYHSFRLILTLWKYIAKSGLYSWKIIIAYFHVLIFQAISRITTHKFSISEELQSIVELT